MRSATKVNSPTEARLIAAAKDMNKSMGLDIPPEGEDVNEDEIPLTGSAAVITEGIRKAAPLVTDEDQFKPDTEKVLVELGIFATEEDKPKAATKKPKAERKVKVEVTKPDKMTDNKTLKGLLKDNPKLNVKMLVKDNPKREGAGSYDRFEKYKNGMTVTAALEAGMAICNLVNDYNKGYIDIV